MTEDYHYTPPEATFVNEGGLIETTPQPHIEGQIFSQDMIWNIRKALNRQHNVNLATGRVNGQFLSHGNKRT